MYSGEAEAITRKVITLALAGDTTCLRIATDRLLPPIIKADPVQTADAAHGFRCSPASGHMRMRISPDVTIALGLRVKRPGEGMEGQDVELILTEQETAFMPSGPPAPAM
jgi:hypothetical protein